MFDRNLLNLPKARQVFALLLACAGVDALLIVAQALCLAAALSWMWSCATASLYDDVVAGALPETLGFMAAFLARGALGALRDAGVDAFSRTCAAKLQDQLVEAVFDQGVEGVQRRGSGAAVQQLIDGVANVRNYLAIILPKIADLIAIPIILAIALFAIDAISGVIALVILPCIVGYMKLLGAHAKAQASMQYKEYNRLANHFMDTLRGLATLKAFGRSKPYANQVFAVSEAFRTATVKTLRTATLSSLVLDLFRTFALAAVAIMLGFRLLAGSMELEPALAVLVMVPEYFAAVRRYSTDFHASLDGRNSLASIVGTIDDSSAAAAGANHALNGLCASDTAFETWNGNSSLEFRGVRFRYGENAPFALDQVDFRIEGPRKVGIVGMSGSGKTTLARLLAGFSTPTDGTIVVNGASVSTLDDPSWLKQVTYIPQDPHIFNATLRENVAFYAPDASGQAIDAAIKLAGLEDVVAQLSSGADTLLGQQGRRLSGGQAQRVALARAFLDPCRKVLIFDEPTAHLDIQTELALKERMLPLMDGKLVFFATHRLHWLEDMDYVLVVEGGRVVESGCPRELLAIDGALSRLARQLRGGDFR